VPQVPQLFALLSSSLVGGHRFPWGTRNLVARADKVLLMRFSQYLMGSLLLSLLCLGTAVAQTATSTVTKTITIKLDKRYGLHLHNSAWTVNLEGAGTGPGSSVGTSNCYRAGFHNSATGRDELYRVGTTPDFLNLFSNARFSGDTLQDSANPYSRAASLAWFSDAAQATAETRILAVSSYPGFEVSGGTLRWAGPIMCVLNTTLEVFSNGQQAVAGNGVKRSSVQASLATTNTRFPKLVLGLSSAVSPGAKATFVTPNSPTPTLLGTLATAQRWTDFPLIQALVFDGTETSTSSGTATLAFTLADFTPVP